MAVRSNWMIADDESSPAVARQKTEKMVQEDNIDAHVGGFLSNICLACMPVWEDAKIVNMISVCLDTTLTTTQVQPRTASASTITRRRKPSPSRRCSTKMGKKWHIAFADYSWGQSTRDAYIAEIKKNGGEVVGTTGIPLGTADMTPFLSKISGDFDGLFGIFFGKDGVTIGNQAYDLGLTKKYKWAGDGVDLANRPTCSRSATRSTASSPSTVTSRCSRARSTRPICTPGSTRPRRGSLKVDPSGPLPDKYVQSNFEALNALKIGMEMSKFQGRDDTMKLIEALEGLEMKAGPDFPQGTKTIRKEDHQAFPQEFLFTVSGGTYHLIETVPGSKTIVPPACNFSA